MDSLLSCHFYFQHGKASMEVFVRNGMPALDGMFKKQTADVQRLLKNLQQSTRALQYMCNHSKVSLDSLNKGENPPHYICKHDKVSLDSI